MMNEEMLNEKLNELMQDESFVSEMQNAESFEDAAKVLSDHGIETTAEELETNAERTQEIMVEKGYMKDGELTEEGLELVAGGRIIGWTLLPPIMFPPILPWLIIKNRQGYGGGGHRF